MAETLVFTITNLALGRLDQPASVLLTACNLRQNSVKEGCQTSVSLVRALNSEVATKWRRPTRVLFTGNDGSTCHLTDEGHLLDTPKAFDQKPRVASL